MGACAIYVILNDLICRQYAPGTVLRVVPGTFNLRGSSTGVFENQDILLYIDSGSNRVKYCHDTAAELCRHLACLSGVVFLRPCGPDFRVERRGKLRGGRHEKS